MQNEENYIHDKLSVAINLKSIWKISSEFNSSWLQSKQ